MPTPALPDAQLLRTRSLGAMDSAEMRRHNLSLVLRAIYSGGLVTRTQIAKSTGLTKTAVAGLIALLLELGILEEEDAVTGRVGRPSRPIQFAGHNFLGACIEVRASSIETLVADLSGAVVERHRTPIRDARGQELIQLVIEEATAAIGAAAEHPGRLIGLAVAVHGIVDRDRGVVLWGPRLGWSDAELKSALIEQLPPDIEIVIDHDASLAALAESLQFAPRGANLVSISSDLGIGAGIIIEGNVYRGSHGYAAQVAHMVIDPSGPECVLGHRGCWSALIGLRTVLREAMPVTAGELERIVGYEAAGQSALLAAAEDRDSETVAALERAGTWLGLGAANIANVLDPDLIIVGGYLAELSPWVMPSAWEALRAQIMRETDPEEALVVTTIGGARALMGGIHLVRMRLLDNPLRLASPARPGS